MSDYFTIKTENALKKAQEEMTCLLKKLLDADSEFPKAAIDQVSVMAGISTERLHEIVNHAPAKSEELHAIGDAIIVLDGLTDNDLYCDLADECEEIIGHWMMDIIFCRDPYSSLDLLRCLSGVDLLDSFFSSYHIFLTEDVLCHEMMGSFLDLAIPLIKKTTNPLKMVVPKVVVENLMQKEKDFEQKQLSGADIGLSNIKRLQEEELLSVRGDESDTTIMSIYISALAKYKPTHKLLLMTQDAKLARAVEMLNESGIEGSEILAIKLSEEHLICEWYLSERADEADFKCDSSDEADLADAINLDEALFFKNVEFDEKLSDEDPEFDEDFWDAAFDSNAEDTENNADATDEFAGKNE